MNVNVSRREINVLKDLIEACVEHATVELIGFRQGRVSKKSLNKLYDKLDSLTKTE